MGAGDRRSDVFRVAVRLWLFRGGVSVVSRGARGAAASAAKQRDGVWVEPAGAGDDGEDSSDAQGAVAHFQTGICIEHIDNSAADVLVWAVRRAGFAGIQQ